VLDARTCGWFDSGMNPHEYLDLLEEKADQGHLEETGLALLALVRRVVARVDVLSQILFEKPESVSLHEEEMKEYVELMGPSLFGDLKPLPEPAALGVADVEIALANRKVFQHRQKARDEGWLIEAIALSAYELEEWLRIWIVSHGGGERFHPDDRHQLGHLIDEAGSFGLDGSLLDRLLAFNLNRNRAIHRLLRGEIPYDELSAAYDADSRLPDDLTTWVVDHLSTFEEAAPEWDYIARWVRWAAEHLE
jgi:hypothetical protein